jgi:hypothetical protein
VVEDGVCSMAEQVEACCLVHYSRCQSGFFELSHLWSRDESADDQASTSWPQAEQAEVWGMRLHGFIACRGTL